MYSFMSKRKITELLNITQDEIEKIKRDMFVGEYKVIFLDENLQISLLKEKTKVYELVYWFGEEPFCTILKKVVNII